MQYEDILGRLSAFCERLNGHAKLVFTKLDVTPAASNESLDALESRLDYGIHPALRAVWTNSASVDFEWFIKAAGCQAAGIDSHAAPSGHFQLLTPDEAESEANFLKALGGDAVGRLFPFSKIAASGELLVIDHDSDAGAVELVLLNSDLSRLVLAPSLDSWFNTRIGTYFEDTSLQKSGVLDPVVQGTLDHLAAAEFTWPPPHIGW